MYYSVIRLLTAAACTTGLAAWAADATPAAKPAEKSATPAAAKPAANPETVLARGKGLEIKRAKLDEMVASYRQQSLSEGREIPTEQLPQLEMAMLDRMVVMYLVGKRATEAEQAKAKETMEKTFAEISAKSATPEVFKAQLKASGMTEESFKARIVEQTLHEAVVEREVSSKLAVDEAAIKKFYDENPKYFDQPEQVRASHVLISTMDQATQQDLPEDKKKEAKATAEKVLARAKKGEDFAALAKEFSQDPGSKDNGGEYTFPRGKMVKEFEESAFSLKPGEVSDLVTTKFGYHIIKLSEKLPAGMEPLAKAHDNIKRYLTQEGVRQKLPEFYEKVKKEAELEILDPALVPPKLSKP